MAPSYRAPKQDPFSSEQSLSNIPPKEPSIKPAPCPRGPTTRIPQTVPAAVKLLVELGAPNRLLSHATLVGEAAELILKKLQSLRVPVHTEFVAVGVTLHDAGKILYPTEFDQPGNHHESAGEALLLQYGVSPELARVCLSHSRWELMDVSFEELLIALADKLWKGVRTPALEERVIDAAANAMGKTRWEAFVELDTTFEDIASAGTERLTRSKSFSGSIHE